MALDFPSNPVNGQTYDNFVYDAVKGTWKSLSSGASPNYLVNPTISNAVITATATTPSTIPLTVNGAASQTANLQNWKNSAGIELATVNSSGHITTPLLYTPTVIATRNDTAYEGGEIRLMRSVDNAMGWSIDTYGNNTTPALRVFDSSGTVRLGIDSAGRVTKPYTPAFTATANYGTNYVSTSMNPIVYQTADLNVGSNYNTSTGRFTAPIAGNYVFMAQAHRNAGGGYTSIRVRKNGTVISNAWCFDPSGNDSLSASVVIGLSTSDYVDVEMVSNQNNYISEQYWKFSGYLLG